METLTLQAETSRLLDLVIHSLYTQREIFLRELVSNASDALDRLHFEALQQPELRDDAAPLGVWLEVDPAARTLTVRDNGIGMSRDEVVSHIGTIARSGTKEFEAQLEAQSGRDRAVDLIGRFGVGFYSSFMVANRVTLVTRRAGETTGVRWESAGDVNYTLTEAGAVPRGTAVTLHLKAIDADEGIEDYTDRWVLSRIIKRYADFVTYPIAYVAPAPATPPTPSAEAPDREAAAAAAAGPIVLNSMKPIWTRPPAEVKASDYEEFYKHLSHDWNAPLLRMSFKAEGRWEYAALLFVPSHAPFDLHYHGFAYGLQLYSQRMLIVEQCQELLPRYLRFLRGVVDAADLPLNVSRQHLQNAHHLANIRKWITRKAIDTLNTLRQDDAQKYEAFWREFGRALKEGISEERENQDRLTPLLLFESSAGDSLTTLAQYVARMKPDQQDIYYVSGESRRIVERSPHLEQFLARGYEVLYFTETVDELLAQSLSEFDGHRLRSVAKGQIEFGDEAEKAQDASHESSPEVFADFLSFVTKQLESKVRAVRLSKRLTVSPACLTGEEMEYSPHIQRLLDGSATRSRRTLELNPQHAIVKSLHARFARDPNDPLLSMAAEVLFGGALLAEGSELPDPAAFSARLSDVLSHALDHDHA